MKDRFHRPGPARLFVKAHVSSGGWRSPSSIGHGFVRTWLRRLCRATTRAVEDCSFLERFVALRHFAAARLSQRSPD
jgi:hypothetical protein